MNVWDYTALDWARLTLDEQMAIADLSPDPGPPLPVHTNYWIMQVIAAAKRGTDVSREVLESMDSTAIFSLALDIIRDWNPKYDWTPKYTDALKQWAIRRTPPVAVVDFIGRNLATQIGGEVLRKYEMGINELGWPSPVTVA